jgi:hypothetical protein
LRGIAVPNLLTRIGDRRFGEVAAQRVESFTKHLLKGRLPTRLCANLAGGRSSFQVSEVAVHALEQLSQRRQSSVTCRAALTATVDRMGVRLQPRRGKRAEQGEHNCARTRHPLNHQPPGFAQSRLGLAQCLYECNGVLSSGLGGARRKGSFLRRHSSLPRGFRWGGGGVVGHTAIKKKTLGADVQSGRHGRHGGCFRETGV